MKQTANHITLMRIIGKILKWYLFIVLPLSTCFFIYLSTSGKDYDSLTNGEIIKIIPHIAKEILSFYPFSDFVASFLEKSFSFHEITAQKMMDGIIKGLITFGLVDFGKYFFNVTKESASTDTKLKHWIKLIIIYGVWVILFSYVAGLLTDKGFQWLESNHVDRQTWFVVKLILLIAFYVISVAKFNYLTKERLLFCMIWVFSDKIVFCILSSLCLTLFSLWAYRNLFETSGADLTAVFVPFLFYLLFAAGIDFVKQKSQYFIVKTFR